MVNRAETQFAVDHVAAAGHFPGNPIIPGAVVLDETLHAIAAKADRPFVPCKIRTVKFLYPVRPGDRMLIFWSTGEDGRTKFHCESQDRVVLIGTLTPSGG
jgi:3-hydroxymyristoyl/3-hydroxydecanoyl-(acyl carrier protein) dehydratase